MGGASSTLTLDYPSDPGLEQAQQDVQALAKAGGWLVSAPQRTELQGAILYESQITPAVRLDAQGQVPLFPLVYAFRRFPEVTFVFVGEATGAPGEFHDENRYLRAEWRRSGSVVTYNLHLKDAGFATPDDVRLVERPAGQPLPAEAVLGGPRRPSTVYLWILLLIGAIGAGVFVWGLTWWLLTRHEAPGADAKKGNVETEAKDLHPGPAGEAEADGIPETPEEGEDLQSEEGQA